MTAQEIIDAARTRFWLNDVISDYQRGLQLMESQGGDKCEIGCIAFGKGQPCSYLNVNPHRPLYCKSIIKDLRETIANLQQELKKYDKILNSDFTLNEL